MQQERSSGTYKPGSLAPPLHVHAPRIKLLSDLHRPLEEHWAGKTGAKKGKGLDAIGSDYTYKHHITRLEEIYTTDQMDPALGLGLGDDPLLGATNVSPQAQLYGIQGLLAPHMQQGYLEWKDTRETGWNPYMRVEAPPAFLNKVSALAEKRVPPPPKQPQKSPKARKNQSPTRPTSAQYTASTSPTGQTAARPGSARFPSPVNQSQSQQQVRAALSSGALSPSLSRPISSTARTTSPPRGAAADFAPQRQQHQQQQYHHHQQQQQQQSSTSYRCMDPSVPYEAMIVHGLYRLTAQQSNTYNAFVELLMQFDSFDQGHIMEDAMRDARSVTLLESFGGTR